MPQGRASQGKPGPPRDRPHGQGRTAKHQQRRRSPVGLARWGGGGEEAACRVRGGSDVCAAGQADRGAAEGSAGPFRPGGRAGSTWCGEVGGTGSAGPAWEGEGRWPLAPCPGDAACSWHPPPPGWAAGLSEEGGPWHVEVALGPGGTGTTHAVHGEDLGPYEDEQGPQLPGRALQQLQHVGEDAHRQGLRERAGSAGRAGRGVALASATRGVRGSGGLASCESPSRSH